MGQPFYLPDVVGASPKTLADFFMGLPGVEQREYATFDSAGRAAHGQARTGDRGPIDDSLDVLRALPDAATDLVDVDAVVEHAEHTSFEWSQVLHRLSLVVTVPDQTLILP